jgi:tripartite-type tricarboxylate transporter receptor subunit TctC
MPPLKQDVRDRENFLKQSVKSSWGGIMNIGARTLVVACASLLALLSTSSVSLKAQDFYKDKTLTLIIGNNVGSGYDFYGRLIGRFMAKYLAGQPSVVPQNMPGALGVKATDYLANIAPKDGTSIALVNPNALIDPLLSYDASLHRYDPTKLGFIGTADSGTKICFSWKTSKIRSFEDVLKAEAIIASTAPAPYPNLLNALAKSKFKIVTGYPGPAEFILAVERGEADVVCPIDMSALNSIRPGLIASGQINVLLQLGMEPNLALTAMGVPEVWSYIDQKSRPIVELLVGEVVVQRPFIAPPGTPAAQLQELRAAFDAAMKDPLLLEEAAKSNLAINPKSGAAVAEHLNKMYAAPKENIELYTKLTRTN